MKAFVWILMCLMAQNIVAQTCSQELEFAQKEFDAGRYRGIPLILKACMENNAEGSSFTEEERQKAYKLVIISLLYEHKKDTASIYLENLLQTYPEYTINPESEPAELVYLYNSYQILPKYSLGLKMGGTATRPFAISRYGANDLENFKENPRFKPNLSFAFAITSNFYFSKRFEFVAELLYQVQKYGSTTRLFTNIGTIESTITERYRQVSMPLMLKYQILQKRYKPVITLGIMPNYLFSHNLTAKTDISQEYNLISHRNPLTYSFISGIGFQAKFNKSFFIFDIRYQYGLSNQANSSKRYDFSNPSHNDLILRYGYLDNNFRLNGFLFTVGYVKTYYKLKKYDANKKSFLPKIK